MQDSQAGAISIHTIRLRTVACFFSYSPLWPVNCPALSIRTQLHSLQRLPWLLLVKPVVQGQCGRELTHCSVNQETEFKHKWLCNP